MDVFEFVKTLTCKPDNGENFDSTETTIIPGDNIMNYTEVGAGYLDNSKLWYSAAGFNGLFCYDLEARKLEWIDSFPNEPYFLSHMFTKCVKWKEFLVFIPSNAHAFFLFDLVTKKFVDITLFEDSEKCQKFNCAVVGEDKVIAFGLSLPYILELDLRTYTQKKRTKLYGELERIGSTGLNYYVSCNLCMDDKNSCYLLGAKANVLIKYYLKTGDFDITRLGDDKGVFNNIIKHNSELFLVPGKERCFSIWDTEKKTMCECDERIWENGQYLEAFRYNNDIVVLPNRSNRILVWNMVEKKIIFFSQYDEKCVDDSEVAKFIFSFGDNYWQLCFGTTRRELYVHNNVRHEFFKDNLYIDDKLKECILKDVVDKHSICVENNFMKLGEYLKIL